MQTPVMANLGAFYFYLLDTDRFFNDTENIRHCILGYWLYL